MKKPNLQTAVSIAEIISAFAIVVSLIYAVNEFRRSQTITSRDVENIAYSRMMELDRLLIENPDFVSLFVKASDNSETLTKEEMIRFLAFEHTYYDSWETLWYYYQEGVMDYEAWNSWNDWFILDSGQRPVIGWKGNRRHFSGGFLKMVDNQLLPKSE
jgi:hypothetical protein